MDLALLGRWGAKAEGREVWHLRGRGATEEEREEEGERKEIGERLKGSKE